MQEQGVHLFLLLTRKMASSLVIGHWFWSFRKLLAKGRLPGENIRDLKLAGIEIYNVSAGTAGTDAKFSPLPALNF